MSTQPGWGWRIYLIAFTLLTISNLFNIFSPQSFLYKYYHILTAFDKKYIILSSLAMVSAITNFLYISLLVLYVFRIRWGAVKFWQGFFILRIFIDFGGHFYEMNYFKSLILTDPGYAVFSFIPIAVLILPSYLAGFQYAFQQSKIFE